MMFPSDWPPWATRLLSTVATVGVSWLIGRVIGATVITRLPRWLPGRQRQLGEAIAVLIRRRLPWWTLLVGVWVAAGDWPLTPEGRLLLERAVFVVGALSVTATLAAVASRSVEAYGSLLAPALPASSLTRNIAWSVVAGLGLLVILNSLGLSITPMLTALGVGGLALALALQEPLANWVNAGRDPSIADRFRREPSPPGSGHGPGAK